MGVKVVRDAVVHQFFASASRNALLGHIGALEKALQRYSANPSIVPPRIVRDTPKSGTLHMIMPVIDDTYCGVKTLGFNPNGNTGFVGSVNVVEPDSGALVGVVDAKVLTAVRTAMSSCIGLLKFIDLLGPSVTVTVYGTGLQAFWHLFLASRLLEGKDVSANILYRSKRMESKELERYFPKLKINQINVSDSAQVSDVVAKSGIIFGCIPSERPSILAAYLDKEGAPFTYVSLIGSYKPHMHECDESLINYFKDQKAGIIVDSTNDSLLESGELIDAKVAPEQLVELGKLSENSKNLKALFPHQRQVVLSKIVGIAIMDVSVASGLLQSMANESD
ncbi:LAMI_0H10308g1_1 [Lachancea mirantina]|uniref:LAMI_0H10308g1_1 n=1 Tax=Lachancea mirantina TaxID=1230905 RepID=A0A1G4KGR4_9SACH|nr:LAMI_0H10308g1_1 [Lachancea mirantina]